MVRPINDKIKEKEKKCWNNAVDGGLINNKVKEKEEKFLYIDMDYFYGTNEKRKFGQFLWDGGSNN